VTERRLELSLPERERRWAAALAAGLTDLLYVPGPGFTSPLDPGLYRSTFLLLLRDGPPLRISSLVVPAFGAELCRLRVEPLQSIRIERLGSLFEPSRRGLIFAMSADRRTQTARPPDQPGWCYEGPPLGTRFGAITRVRLLTERATGRLAGEEIGWVVDRGVALTGADGQESLLLATPEVSEHAAFLPAPGLYRALIDPTAPATPGATVKELLGYGDWDGPLDVTVELEPL
jgi:hypothetical protein